MARQYIISFSPHKRFQRSVLAILTMAAFALLNPATALAQDDALFKVEGVKVDVTAPSANEARQHAFDKAQQDAFQTVASRILPPDRMKTFTPPPVTDITTMVDDFEITNEQLSTVRYIGTYTFRFKGATIRNYLNSHSAAPMPAPMAEGSPVMPSNPDAAFSPRAQAAAAMAAAQTAMPSTPYVPPSTVRARVRFTTMQQWIALQKSLQRAPGIVVQLSSLKQGEAIVDLSYTGGIEMLRQSLAQASLALNDPGNGAYVPQPYNEGWTQGSSAANGTIYEITAAATAAQAQAPGQAVQVYPY